MISANAGAFAVILILFGILQSGKSLRCYECEARVRRGEKNGCLNGDVAYLGQVNCLGASNCIFYHYQNVTSDIIRVKRGCLMMFKTCSDEFDNLRKWSETSLPGYTCIRCDRDLCNSSSKIKTTPLVLTMIIYALPWLYI